MNDYVTTSLEQFATHICAINGRMEVLNQPIFDTIIYPKEGIGKINFFANPIGVQGKTYVDTNMYLPNELPGPQAFYVTGIALKTDKRLSLGALELIIGCKSYYRYAPLSAFFRNPYHPDSIKPPFSFDPGLGISSHQNFTIELYFPRRLKFKKDIPVRAELCGYLYRPVV